MKRLVDLVLSLLGLIFLFPLLLIVSLLVYFNLGFPIIYTQERPGLHSKPFKMYKFRSMLNLHDNNGIELPDAARLTPFGKFLRSTSLDELPELFNVLIGDMSLVGPRPLLMQYLPLYTSEQSRRHDIKPGITGWAQVNGRNAISWDEKFILDLWYVDNRNILLDMKILLLTVKKVIKRDSIASPNSITMEGFKGYNKKSD